MDPTGVATSGAETAIDCENTLLRSEDEYLALVGLGLRNIAAIAMSDGMLVVDMDNAQDVGRVGVSLKDGDARQAQQFPRDHRPCGWFETLATGTRFEVKCIVVHLGVR